MKQIEFNSLDGLTIYGHLSAPNSPVPLPAILIISGGIHGGIFLEDGTYDPLHLATSQYLNSAGFITLNVDKRGSKGYGKKYQSHLDFNGKEVEDIIAGLEYLQKLDFVSKDKIALHGTSRGATTAGLVLTKTNGFKAAILASGFYDILEEYQFEREYRSEIWPTRQSIQGKDILEIPYFERSPINYIQRINTPILLVHGLDDTIVLSDRSNEFYKALLAGKKDVEMRLYERFAHLKEFNYPSHPVGKNYWEDCISFLRRKLI